MQVVQADRHRSEGDKVGGFFQLVCVVPFQSIAIPRTDSNRRWQGPVFPSGVESRIEDIISCSPPDGFGDAMICCIDFTQHADEHEV